MRLNIGYFRLGQDVRGLLLLLLFLGTLGISTPSALAALQQPKSDDTKSGFWKNLEPAHAAKPPQVADDPNAQSVEPRLKPQITLAPSGLADNQSPEELLPPAAILHLRINEAGKLLDDISDMAMPFVPEQAVGPMAEIALEESNPLLAMIGIQTMEQPMSVEMLSEMSGIDSKRPLTLSLYLAPLDQGFVVCIPVTDLNRFSAMLGQAIPMVAPPQEVQLDGGTAQLVESPDFNAFVVCSKDMVALCGSAEIAQAMLDAPGQINLSQSALISEAITKHSADNILLAIDTAPLKPFLPMLKQYQQIPSELIAEMREEALSEMDEEGLIEFNRQLQMRFGVRDVEQLMDYAECLANGSYEVLFEGLYQFAEDFQGLTVAVDLGKEFQSLKVALMSNAITEKSATQPIPMKQVKQAISTLPGRKNFLTVSGKTAPPQKWEWVNRVIERIGKKMSEKELPMETHAAIAQAYDSHVPLPTLESMVDWTIKTRLMHTGKLPHEYESLADYLANIVDQNSGLMTLNAIPPHDAKFLQDYFAAKAKAYNSNCMNWTKLRSDFSATQPWLISSSRSDSEELDHGVTRLIYEDIYRTRGGLFGYNEHELINRYFMLHRTTENYSLLWPGGNNPTLFAELTGEPIAKAFDNLLAGGGVSENVQQLEYLRLVHLLLDGIDFVASLETLLHRDLENYLSEIQKLADEVDTEEELVAKSKKARLEMPIHLAHVNYNPDTKELYLVTPIAVTYPRPKVLPAAVELLKDYRQVADAVGGAIVHQSTTDGRYECTVVQSTAGLSSLVRTLGNNVSEQYLKNRGAQQELESKIYNALDRESSTHERILTNENWFFLPW